VAGFGMTKSGLGRRFEPKISQWLHLRATLVISRNKGPNPGLGSDLITPGHATMFRGVFEHGESIPGLYSTQFHVFRSAIRGCHVCSVFFGFLRRFPRAFLYRTGPISGNFESLDLNPKLNIISKPFPNFFLSERNGHMPTKTQFWCHIICFQKTGKT
jgi:hypothetical protein